MPAEKPTTIDAYITGFPDDAQQAMQHLRALIHDTVPGVTEQISYAMPAFEINNRYVVYFAAYKKHIGLYPAPVAEPAFQQDFAGYKTGKGSIQFPLGQPMPDQLIRKILDFLLKENKRKAGKHITGT